MALKEKRNTNRRKTRAGCSSLNMATTASIHNTKIYNPLIYIIQSQEII